MAIVFGVYDKCAERIEEVRKYASALKFDIPGLEYKNYKYDNLLICCWHSTSTPIFYAQDMDSSCKRVGFVVGDYDDSRVADVDGAKRLLKKVNPGAYEEISGKSGFYFAAIVEECGRVVLGTEALGYFPMYYCAKNDVLLFGTSPELFKSHPLFDSVPNPFAIASILLLSHISCGQALYKGVYRHSPGCLVEWEPHKGALERKANPVVLTDIGFGRSFKDIRDETASLLDDFFRKISVHPSLSQFLSGGQDSRLLAGYVKKHFSDDSVCAVSVGRSSDMEVRVARKVSKKCGWRHVVRDFDENRATEFASTQLFLESMQGPFVSFVYGTGQELLAEKGVPFVSGYPGDGLLGDKLLMSTFSRRTGLFCFDAFFESVNRYGFSIADVTEIMASQGAGGVVDDVVSGLRDGWDAIEGYPFQKGWLYPLLNRGRYHVGSIIWRLSLGAWPLLPYLDRSLVNLIASLPMQYLHDRMLQKDIIIKDFRGLADIPMDRNSWEFGYLVKPKSRYLFEGLKSFCHASWRVGNMFDRLERAGKTKYYYRVYDVNGNGWQHVLQEVGLNRSGGSKLFNSKYVDRFLPRHGTHHHCNDEIVDTWKYKSLIGLLLWESRIL